MDTTISGPPPWASRTPVMGLSRERKFADRPGHVAGRAAPRRPLLGISARRRFHGRRGGAGVSGVRHRVRARVPELARLLPHLDRAGRPAPVSYTHLRAHETDS